MSVAAVACGCNGSLWRSARIRRNTRCVRLARYGPKLSLMLQSGKRMGVCNTRINKECRAVHPEDPLEARSLEQTGKIIDRPFPVCFYAFMRTTIELPPDLMRAAKSRSAAQGETLKELVTRALEAELGRSRHVRSTGVRVQLPLFGNPTSARVAVTNEAIERVQAADDALTRSKKPRRK